MLSCWIIFKPVPGKQTGASHRSNKESLRRTRRNRISMELPPFSSTCSHRRILILHPASETLWLDSRSKPTRACQFLKYFNREPNGRIHIELSYSCWRGLKSDTCQCTQWSAGWVLCWRIFHKASGRLLWDAPFFPAGSVGGYITLRVGFVMGGTFEGEFTYSYAH